MYDNGVDETKRGPTMGKDQDQVTNDDNTLKGEDDNVIQLNKVTTRQGFV